MSANYRSKLYHKSILLKPANTQLFEIFCHNNSVYSFLCWQSREITIRPTLKWLAKFKRGLTRFRTWSHTRWWWWCFCFFINFFFSWWECDTHMCSHVHSNPDLLSTATRRERRDEIWPDPNRRWLCDFWKSHGRGPLSWELAPVPLTCLPSPCQTPIPPKIKAGEENDKMSEPSGSSDIVHPCALAVSSNDALLKCQTN